MRAVAVLALILLGGCQMEERVVSNSLDNQLGALNKDKWQVTRGDQQANPTVRDDHGVTVINSPQYNLQFRTNFRIDEPAASRPATQPSPAPGPTLWAPPPTTIRP